MSYIWQRSRWPAFYYDLSGVQELLYEYAQESHALSGGFAQIPEETQLEALIDLMISEALSTSEIEGERFNPIEVRSSIKRNLGLYDPVVPRDPRAIGIAKLMVEARKTFEQPLSDTVLWHWHELILTTDNPWVDEIGQWRTSREPMQIVSGAYGHEKVHFEAPPSECLDKEMKAFMVWFNATDPKNANPKIPGPVRAAIAHLYFECLHPFSDGNGRLGRAISEKALSQEMKQPVLLSLSATIQKNKKHYYEALSKASSGDLDITEWVEYFVRTVYQAQLDAKKQIRFVLTKTKFWHSYENRLNERQVLVLQRMFKAGANGFEGGIQAKKYMKMAECSKATATRDLRELLELGCVRRMQGGGRSTRYELDV